MATHSDTQGVSDPGSSLGEPTAEFSQIPIPLRGHADVSNEEGPWSRKVVLSLDGGGIRGYSSLLILKRIMLRIRELEQPTHTSSSSYSWMGSGHRHRDGPGDRVDNFLPCHYFDYVAGTSTGGLSAIMLGRLRMTVDEALDQYIEFGNAVFGKPRWFHERSILWYPRAKFSCHRTREAFQMAIYKSLQRDRAESLPHEANAEAFKYREDRTRTMTVSWSIRKEGGVSRQYVWRTYDNNFNPEARDSNRWNPPNPCPAHTTKIWEVARATTAAPRWFESIKIGDRKFLDGGMVANNPSLLALREIHELHDTVPALFVSIGTGLKSVNESSRPPNTIALGRSEASDNVRRKQWLRKYIEIGRHWKETALDCEGESGTNGWRSHCSAIGLDRAFRLNVNHDLHTLSLDDWQPPNTGASTLQFIRQRTDAYLELEEVRGYIDQIAQEAVRIRHQRAATERWESFAVDVDYWCRMCPRSSKYEDRAELRAHLQESSRHKGPDGLAMTAEQIEVELNRGRQFKHQV